MSNIQTKRLVAGDNALAKVLFVVMAEVFQEGTGQLRARTIERLLTRDDFWAIAALADAQVIGGLTAHTLPMTRSDSFEVFIYDIAVKEDYQRKGVGRLLVETLRQQAAKAGIHEVFVLADNDDSHALDFYRALGGVAAPVTAFTFSENVKLSGNSRS